LENFALFDTVRIVISILIQTEQAHCKAQ